MKKYMKSIAVIDYGMGNLLSVAKAVEICGGVKVSITDSARRILSSDAVILPGVGAFDEAVKNLKRTGLWKILPEVIFNKPFMGICLGFQLLFERSEEGKLKGLGIFKDRIKLFKPSRSSSEIPLRVPHIGWNKVEYKKGKPPLALKGIPSGGYFYFVHSYYAPSMPSVSSGDRIFCHTNYGGIGFLSAIEFNSGKAFACQFHPEKSGTLGLKVIKNFILQNVLSL